MTGPVRPLSAAARLAYTQALQEAYQEAWWAARALLERSTTPEERVDGLAAIQAGIDRAGDVARVRLWSSTTADLVVVVDLEAMFGPRRRERISLWRRAAAVVRRRRG